MQTKYSVSSNHRHHHTELLAFTSVTDHQRSKPFNRLSPKSGKWKEVNIQTALPRIRSVQFYQISKILRNVLPKFIELCMETPCWYPSWGAPTWQLETNRNICHWVLLQYCLIITWGTLSAAFKPHESKTWNLIIFNLNFADITSSHSALSGKVKYLPKNKIVTSACEEQLCELSGLTKSTEDVSSCKSPQVISHISEQGDHWPALYIQFNRT